MQTAAIAYRNDELEACERDDVWTVRLANLEARARYLDLALAELLHDASEAHRLAARLVGELGEAVEHQEAADPRSTATRPQLRRSARLHELWTKPLLLALRVLMFGVVASTVFMLTTWLSALR